LLASRCGHAAAPPPSPKSAPCPRHRRSAPRVAARARPGADGSGFHPGRFTDVSQVEFTGEITWSLTGNALAVSEGSTPRCQGSITIYKRLVPSTNTGKFALLIDEKVEGGASAVGNDGTTGTIDVDTGRRIVSEEGAPGTSLGNYTTAVSCESGGNSVGQGGTSVSVTVRRGQAIECTFTNSAKAQARQVTPVLECVVFNDGAPDIAVWGLQQHERGPRGRARRWDERDFRQLLRARSSDP